MFQKTHCINGHPYKGNRDGYRCRECRRLQRTETYHNHKEYYRAYMKQYMRKLRERKKNESADMRR